MSNEAVTSHITAIQFAALHNVHRNTVTRWLCEGVLKGAQKVMGVWLIPADLPMPPKPPRAGRPRGSKNSEPIKRNPQWKVNAARRHKKLVDVHECTSLIEESEK